MLLPLPSRPDAPDASRAPDPPPQAPAAPPGPDPAAMLAWAARRGVSPQWRSFLLALAGALEEALPPDAQAALLRRVGARLAALQPIRPAATLLEVEGRVNAALAAMDWGHAAFLLDAGRGLLVIRHWAAPLVAAEGDPAGRWIAPVLEGLHESWLAAASGAGAPALRCALAEPGLFTLHSA